MNFDRLYLHGGPAASPKRLRKSTEEGVEAPMRSRIHPPSRSEYDWVDNYFIEMTGVADAALDDAVREFFRDEVSEEEVI